MNYISLVKVKSLSRVQLFAIPLGFSGQRYWSGLPFLSPEDLPDPGIEPRSTCIAGRRFTLWAIREAEGELELIPKGISELMAEDMGELISEQMGMLAMKELVY